VFKHTFKFLPLSVINIFNILFVLNLLVGCGGPTNRDELSKTSAPPPASKIATIVGPKKNFYVRQLTAGSEVMDMIGQQGKVYIPVDVDMIKFDDLSLHLRVAKNSTTIHFSAYKPLVELYIAYFNRVPDAEGMQYWIDQYKSGMSLEQIGESFYTAAVHFSDLTGFSAEMSNTAFVDIIYRNVLGRDTADIEGLKYWTGQLDSGKLTRGTLILTMLSSAHSFSGDSTWGWVANLLDDKFYVGEYFAVTLGISFNTSQDSIKNGKSIMALVSRANGRDAAFSAIETLVGAYKLPVADAGLAQQVIVGDTAFLNGESSYDAEKKPLSYAWKLVGKPSNSALVLLETNQSKVSFVPDVTGSYQFELVVDNKQLTSTPSPTMVIVESAPTKEKTVVIRTVTTSPSWGQESSPGWHHAAIIKDAPGYSLYDLEIVRDSSNRTIGTRLYKFDNTYPSQQGTRAYMASKLLLEYKFDQVNTSPQLRDALKNMMAKIFEREAATRIVLAYSGHGGPTSFFEGAMLTADAQNFLQNLKTLAGTRPLILDFSTNCNTGYFDFVASYYKYADYLIASELLVGGYGVGGSEITLYLKYIHDFNLHNYWAETNSTKTALLATLSGRRSFWHGVEVPLKAANVQQSLAAYDLNAFYAFMKTLKTKSSFNPNQTLYQYSQDLGTYVKQSADPQLTSSFRTFQVDYVSNRDIVSWTNDTMGFSVLNMQTFNTFLASVQ
jgi:hypothetical protein